MRGVVFFEKSLSFDVRSSEGSIPLPVPVTPFTLLSFLRASLPTPRLFSYRGDLRLISGLASSLPLSLGYLVVNNDLFSFTTRY